MKKTVLISGLIFCFLLLPLLAFAQTEVIYPSIPGTFSLQEITESAETGADALPLFAAYLFRLLLVVSISVVLLVIIYGGLLYIFSGDDIEKKKKARGWITSAIHGTVILLISHSILYAISPRLLTFQLTDLEERRRISQIDLEWRIKDAYFQVPLGRLIENAALNVNARDKVYDVLDAVDEAEREADAVVEGGHQLLEIIEECPEGRECDCDEPYFYPHPIPFSPHLPHARPPNALIMPEDISRNFIAFSQAPHGLRKTLINNAVGKAKVEIETLRESDFKDELEKIVEKLETLMDKGPTTESLREIRGEMDRFLKKYEQEIGVLSGEMKDALENLVNVLPKARTGFNDSTYYAQFEDPWGPMPFGRTTTFASAGCYVTSVAMVVDSLLEQKVTPIDVRSYSLAYIGNGTTYNVVHNAANQYPELEAKKLPTMEAILGALDQGHMVIMGGGGTPHSSTRTGLHAYVLTGIDREKGVVYRSDPSVPYWQTLPIHELKRNNPNIADTIYRRSGAENENSLFYAFLNNMKIFPFSALESGINLLSSFFAEMLKTEEARASCCDPCPEISPSVRMKIAEIRYYMEKFKYHLIRLVDAKAPLEEDIFQLHKASMIKTLGAKHIVPYTSFLLDRRYREKEEVEVVSYQETKELPSYYRTTLYYWDWEKWIENIIYKTRVGGEIVEENDPTTFYLKKPKDDEIIRDAERLAREENWQTRRAIPPYVWWYLEKAPVFPPILPVNPRRDKSEIPPFLWWHIVEKPLSVGPDEGRYPPCPCPQSPPCPTFPIRSQSVNKENPLYVLRQDIEETIKNLPQKIAVDYATAVENIPQDIAPDEFKEMFDSPAEYLTCGMEIPVGEPIDIIWNHYTSLLNTIDDYLVEGACFLELQEIMNRLAEPCSCPCTSCSGCDEDPPYCGECDLTCDKEAIYAAHNDVLESRERLRDIRNRIALLTAGYFNAPTENVCHRLNEDIRSTEERAICAAGGSKSITKHELITRKLNYSRAELDACITRPEHFEDTLEGKRTGKIPLFGPVVEEEDLPRYTKTRKDGFVVNTHNLNWFCCSYTPLKEGQ